MSESKYLSSDIQNLEKNKANEIKQQDVSITWNDSLTGKNHKMLYKKFHLEIKTIIDGISKNPYIKTIALDKSNKSLFKWIDFSIKNNLAMAKPLPNLNKPKFNSDYFTSIFPHNYNNVAKYIPNSLSCHEFKYCNTGYLCIINYYMLQYLYWYLSQDYNRFILYGATYLSIFKSDHLNIFISGERHSSNKCNIPANSIHIYALFEQIIEYYITNTKHDIHLFLEVTQRYSNKSYATQSNEFITNIFMPDYSAFYYYIRLCRDYLYLDENLFTDKERFNALLKKYKIEHTILSNFNNNFLDRIHIHNVDHRALVSKFINVESIVTYPKFIDNFIIFAEKRPSSMSIKDLEPILHPDQNSYPNKTVYQVCYEELITNGAIDSENFIKAIDKISSIDFDNIPLDAKYSAYMDHICILQMTYIDWINQSTNRSSTFLFHGGMSHSFIYTEYIKEYFKYKYTDSKVTTINNDLFKEFEENKLLVDDNSLYMINIHELFTEFPEIKRYMDNNSIEYSVDILNSNEFSNANISDNNGINYRFLEKCKSKLTDDNISEIKEDLTGGLESNSYLQMQQIVEPQKQLTNLEQMKLAELRIFFEGVDVIASVEQVLEFATSCTNQKSADLTGGGRFRNPWVQFLLG